MMWRKQARDALPLGLAFYVLKTTDVGVPLVDYLSAKNNSYQQALAEGLHEMRAIGWDFVQSVGDYMIFRRVERLPDL